MAGNSALREAFVRALASEARARANMAQGDAPLDVEAFYDSIEYPIIADTAARLNFPTIALFLEMQTRASPRAASHFNSNSLPFQTTRSHLEAERALEGV